MSRPASPFDTIESTQEFNEIFEAAIAETIADVRRDIDAARAAQAHRQLEALLLVQHKLEKLSGHVAHSRRLLNDLRMLRRLLFEERNSQRFAVAGGNRE